MFKRDSTLLNFGTKCEGKFVPVSPTNNVATEHVQCTAAAGLGWWENKQNNQQTVSANKKKTMILKVMCQPMTGRSQEHATHQTTESDVF